MAEEIKKSYNPFRMLGSWIGLIISILPILSGFHVIGGWEYLRYINPIMWFLNCNESGCGLLIFIGLILNLIFGFLLGWGIHLIFRKFKSK